MSKQFETVAYPFKISTFLTASTERQWLCGSCVQSQWFKLKHDVKYFCSVHTHHVTILSSVVFLLPFFLNQNWSAVSTIPRHLVPVELIKMNISVAHDVDNATLQDLCNQLTTVALPLIYMFVIVVSTPCNLLSFILLCTYTKRKTSTIIFAINLSLVDLLYSVSLPLQVLRP